MQVLGQPLQRKHINPALTPKTSQLVCAFSNSHKTQLSGERAHCTCALRVRRKRTALPPGAAGPPRRKLALFDVLIVQNGVNLLLGHGKSGESCDSKKTEGGGKRQSSLGHQDEPSSGLL